MTKIEVLTEKQAKLTCILMNMIYHKCMAKKSFFIEWAEASSQSEALEICDCYDRLELVLSASIAICKQGFTDSFSDNPFRAESWS